MPNTDTSHLNSSNGRANDNIPPVVDPLHEPNEYISNGTCLIFKFTSKIQTRFARTILFLRL